MKNFRRIILVGTMVLGTLAVTACGNDTEIKSTNTETEQQIMEVVVDETEISERVFDSYADVEAFMHTPEYIVDTAEYSEEAISLMYKLVSTMMLEKDQSFDMTELSETQREKFNYNLLNEGFGYGFIPETTDEVTGGPAGVHYETEVLNSYLSSFYEGGKVGDSENNLLQQYEEYTVYMPSDVAERHTFLQYGMYQYGEYLLIEAPCYYADVERMNSMPSYTASVLFKITEDELYPVQMLHVTTYEKELSETILLKEGTYSCHDIQNERYGISISNIRDYGEYQKFDMELGIDSTQDIGRSIDYKEIICYDVILEGNVAKFESVEEWYYPDYGYSDEKVEAHNGFYGEFTIQEDGSLLLTYEVKDDSDGWILNHSLEPITLK